MIKAPSGTQWLTIPVEVKGKYLQKINETRISDPNWGNEHWQTLKHVYGKLSGFTLYRDIFEELYHKPFTLLSEVNYAFINAICNILNIKTKIRWSSEFTLPEGKTERLVYVCKALGATDYYTGPAAKNYMQDSLFTNEGINIHYYDYSGYPEYEQRFPPFTHGVSILDLLFSRGESSRDFMKIKGEKK